MPPLDDQARLRHMLDAAQAAQRFLAGRTQEDLHTDLQLQMAVAHCVQIIGEAAARLSEQTQADIPELPWRDIRAMRNQIVHVYFDLDTAVLWKTVCDDLPPLIDAVGRSFPVEGDDPRQA
ncbi:MAG: HepT-like ribonuclease domain-containing protein [Phycisphaeraceae bacterium]